MKYGKDGGPESRVWGWWLVELKRAFSIALLRFEDGTREAYHSHAFNCISWVLRGQLVEHHLDGRVEVHRAGLRPVITRRATFHKVASVGRTWVLTFRGPWEGRWAEWVPRGDRGGRLTILEHGRRVVAEADSAVSP